MSWVAYRRPKPRARLRLFAFPFGGGGASSYRNWHDSFGEEIDVCPIQIPGREGRVSETAFTQIQPLIDALADGLDYYSDLPFVFFGHSMGALICYELVRRLIRDDRMLPARIFVSGCRAPRDMPHDRTRHQLADSAFTEELRRLGTPSPVLENSDMMAYLMPILRADFELVDTYRYSPGPQIDSAITAFGGTEDSEVSEEGLNGWRAETSGDFRLTMFPGDHFYILDSSGPLIEAIRSDLGYYYRSLLDKG
ncbi:MAG: thioesterase II family protein [Terriglobia bacterium]